MSKLLFKSLLIAPAIVGSALLYSGQALAQSVPAQNSQNSIEDIKKYGSEGKGRRADVMDQVTSVSQLSDVQPTDWAFQALQSLVERYGCIVGYPDGTYRGNRALTRYEFAAGLNACMDRVNELIATATADLVTKEDLATLQRLQEEFAAELATLRGRVDALEARTATLEAQQFSTTTKLVGEAIFAISSPLNNPGVTGAAPTALTPDGAIVKTPSNNQIVFQDRVRLALNTSFTGKDLLVTRLDAGNAIAFNLPGGSGAEATQTFNFAPNTTNTVGLGWLAYYLPLGDRGQLYIPAYAGLQYDYAPTISPFLDAFDGGTGPLSVFAQRNSIYNIGGGSGVGLNYSLTKNFTVSLGYLASNNTGVLGGAGTFAANNPAQGNGLFNGNYSALAQLTINPSDAFSLGLTYVNAYRTPGSAIFDTGSATPAIGTALGNLSAVGAPGGTGAGTAVNSYGISASFKVSPQFGINGWVNYTAARVIGSPVIAGAGGDGDIWSYALGLAFPDLGKKGNLGGIVVGVQPYLAGFRSGGNSIAIKNDAPVHIEGFYKYQLNDNISITPGVIWIIAPGQDNRNDNSVIGTIRTTFTF